MYFSSTPRTLSYFLLSAEKIRGAAIKDIFQNLLVALILFSSPNGVAPPRVNSTLHQATHCTLRGQKKSKDCKIVKLLSSLALSPCHHKNCYNTK